jgi:hypothetical protein
VKRDARIIRELVEGGPVIDRCTLGCPCAGTLRRPCPVGRLAPENNLQELGLLFKLSKEWAYDNTLHALMEKSTKAPTAGPKTNSWAPKYSGPKSQ